MTTGEARGISQSANPPSAVGRVHLILDSPIAEGLAAKPLVARRLPAELARRFHALPIAEDNGRITVAMADPDDVVARQAIASALAGDLSPEGAARSSLLRIDPEEPQAAQTTAVAHRNAFASLGAGDPTLRTDFDCRWQIDPQSPDPAPPKPAQAREICAVRGDPELIDALLAQIWGLEPANQPDRIRILALPSGSQTPQQTGDDQAPEGMRFANYAKEISGLLGADLRWATDSADAPHLVLLDHKAGTCLGRAWFAEHSSALIRGARGFVFLREMDIREFRQTARSLRKAAEDR